LFHCFEEIMVTDAKSSIEHWKGSTSFNYFERKCNNKISCPQLVWPV
jgi:hypothetical protein